MTGDDDVYFFIHVMKTAGTSFVFYMQQALGRDCVFPQEGDALTAHFMLDELRAASHERGTRLRGYSGHFPAFAADLVGATKTVTLLRHPVERTISYLKQCRRSHKHHAGLRLEKVYADEFYFKAFIENHQTKIFSMTPGDGVESYMDAIAIDATRLDAAKERLAAIDVVGVQERYPQALLAVQDAFGWDRPSEDWHVRKAREVPVSDDFRDQIAEDNAWDIELYDWAASTVAAGR